MASSKGPRRTADPASLQVERDAVARAREDLLFIEPDGSNREEVRRLGYKFIDLLVDAEARATERLPLDRNPGSSGMAYTPSEGGRDVSDLLREVEAVLSRGMNPAHPGYMGHMDTLASAVGIFRA
jgi:hypothetical protein